MKPISLDLRGSEKTCRISRPCRIATQRAEGILCGFQAVLRPRFRNAHLCALFVPSSQESIGHNGQSWPLVENVVPRNIFGESEVIKNANQ